MPAFGGASKLDDALPGHWCAVGEDLVHAGDVAGFWVADVGQVSKEGSIGSAVVP